MLGDDLGLVMLTVKDKRYRKAQRNVNPQSLIKEFLARLQRIEVMQLFENANQIKIS
jgi:hypothetical protein